MSSEVEKKVQEHVDAVLDDLRENRVGTTQVKTIKDACDKNLSDRSVGRAIRAR